MTRRFFSSASSRMRRKIRCDCAGDPPGELMASATAAALRTAKTRSSVRATPAIVRPGRSGVEKPMTPVSRTTGTTGTIAAEALRNEFAKRRQGARAGLSDAFAQSMARS